MVLDHVALGTLSVDDVVAEFGRDLGG
ncbi:MAG: hypothetical protein QOE92_995, partial [Chloroflexota bacterium]|nr:hypothetical protein [Chloroflexota bacterium]